METVPGDNFDTTVPVIDNTQIAGDILNAILKTQQAGEWMSATINITAGPNEAPVVFLALLPGTTPDNAKKIQSQFMLKGAELNEG